MSFIKRGTVVTCFVLAVLLLSPTFLPAQELLPGCKGIDLSMNHEATSDFSRKYQAAHTWVRTQRPDDVPNTYEEIMEYHSAYRAAIVGALPPDLKRDFWVRHLERYLSNDSFAFTPDQVALVHEALTLAKAPGFFDVSTDTEWESTYELRIQAFLSLADDHFDNEKLSMLFFQPAGNGPGIEPGFPEGRLSTKGVIPICNCFGICSAGFCYQNVECIPIICGFFGLFTCDGVCGYLVP